MMLLLTLIGFMIALAIFLYVLNTIESGKEKIKQLQQKRNHVQHGRQMNTEQRIESLTDAETYTASSLKDLPENVKNMLPERRCPLCRKILSRDEPLYATHIEYAGNKKILIHGCPYCYKDKYLNPQKDEH
jgi:rubrerythrin